MRFLDCIYEFEFYFYPTLSGLGFSWSVLIWIFWAHRPRAVRECGPFLHLSHVAWSVCLCAGHITGELCINGWSDRDAVGADSCESEDGVHSLTRKDYFVCICILYVYLHFRHKTYRPAHRHTHKTQKGKKRNNTDNQQHACYDVYHLIGGVSLGIESGWVQRWM